MKAIEYFNKYYPRLALTSPNQNAPIVADIIVDMNKEMQELIQKRHITQLPGIMGVFKEFNQKWKCLVQIFNDNGYTYLQEDLFKTISKKVYDVDI